MSIAILLLVAAAATLSVHDSAEQERIRQAMKLDLHACVRPAYPRAALADWAGGKSTLEIQLDAEGKVAHARVAVSSGRADLDASALAGVRTCSFHVLATLGKPPDKRYQAQFVWTPGEAPRPLDPALVASTQQLAEEGDPVAQNTLGTWHEQGRFFKRDMAQAAAWYRRAADSGHAQAQNNLGVLYYRGNGVPGDRGQAVYWYAKAAVQGHGWAQDNLAWAYQYGTAGEQNMDKALHWLTRSAEGGLAPAQVRLGLLLLDRADSDEQRAEAEAWLVRASTLDDPKGRYYLGRVYERGLGTAQDDAQAAAQYRKALGRSSGRAETALATLIEAGRARAETPDEALALFEAAMRARDTAAFYGYSVALERRGDSTLASAMLRHGADKGHCEAGIRLMQIRMADDPDYNAKWRRMGWPTSLAVCDRPLESRPLF